MRILVVHLSHTDINYDSRILKQIASLSKLENFKVQGLGVLQNVNKLYENNHNLNVDTISLQSRYYSFLPSYLRYFINYIELTFKLLLRLIKLKPEIIHCHDIVILPIGFILKFFLKSKLVYDAHELESQKSGQSKILSKIIFIVEKIIWTKVDLFITVSDSISNWYNKNLGFKKSIVVLNSPESSQKIFASGTNKYLREYFNIPLERKIFLYIGLIDYGRSIELYLDVFKNNNVDSHIVFLGYGDYLDKVLECCTEYDNIHYHPAVKYNDVIKIANSADVGLCLIPNISLSYYFSLPNKFFEYALSGIYIVASDFPEMSRIINEYNLGETIELNKESLLKTVKKLEKSEALKPLNKLNYLGWSYQAEQLKIAYQRLLN